MARARARVRVRVRVRARVRVRIRARVRVRIRCYGPELYFYGYAMMATLFLLLTTNSAK